MGQLDQLGFGSWITRGAGLRASFKDARPFPHVVIDGFLDEDLATQLLAEFPSIDAMPKSRDYVFSNKRELSSVEQQGPAGARYAELMLGDEFRTFVTDLLETDGLFVDPMFYGGGFHQGGDGSFLDMHTDFNLHPEHHDWFRMLNVLLYLNQDWDPAWGGDLLIKASPEQEPTAVAPLFNRAVIMETSDRTYHGYTRMSLPPGISRKSVASYVYRPVEGEVEVRSTGWVPEDAGAAKRLLAKNYNRLVQAKQRLMGTGTSRNR